MNPKIPRPGCAGGLLYGQQLTGGPRREPNGNVQLLVSAPRVLPLPGL